jgi:hypothetical protein
MMNIEIDVSTDDTTKMKEKISELLRLYSFTTVAVGI